MTQKLLFFTVLWSIQITANAQIASGSFSVGGNSGSFYPVMFSVSGTSGMASLGKLSIYINNVHTNGVWSGSFHSDIEFISSNWGHIYTKIPSFTYITGSGGPYSDPIGDIKDGSTAGSNSQLIIWLKGGATYQWSTTADSQAYLMDSNIDGIAKISASGNALDIISSQSQLVMAAKDKRYLKDVGLRVDNTTYMPGTGIWNSTGNVGIGTTTPQAKLQIGACVLNNTEPYNVLVDTYRNDKGIAQYSGNWCSPARWGIGPLNNLSNSTIRIGTVADTYGSWSDTQNLNLVIGGSVGIGTTAPDQKLTVKGKIHAEEVIVDLNVPVADYVFAKDYDLMPLHKVEQYVQQNSHLPDIPSASEIKEQGLSMGEMQNKLLKKIEELTLYVIEQNKTINKQQLQIEYLNNNFSKLEKK